MIPFTPLAKPLRECTVALVSTAGPDEIEEVFYNKFKLRKTKQNRYLLYGVTDSGRYLFVVFAIMKKAKRSLARVISARDMTQREKRYYLK